MIVVSDLGHTNMGVAGFSLKTAADAFTTLILHASVFCSFHAQIEVCLRTIATNDEVTWCGGVYITRPDDTA